MINTSELLESISDTVNKKYRTYLKHILDKSGVKLPLGTVQQKQWMLIQPKSEMRPRAATFEASFSQVLKECLYQNHTGQSLKPSASIFVC